MIITSLKKKNNDVLVVLDDLSSFLLDYRTVIDYRLIKGEEIDEDKKENLLNASQFLKARDSAFRLITRRPHSAYELKIKLIKKKFNFQTIAKVIDDLREKKYLNEDDFAKAFVEERIHRKRNGVNKLKSQLAQRGIDKKIIEVISKDIDENLYLENASFVARKKYESIKAKETDSKKIQYKLFSYLMQKGYETDIIQKVMNELKIEFED